MKSALLFLLAGLANAQAPLDCPANPAGMRMGPAVPIVAADIPAGCSAFEVLVARGTSEPSFKDGGKFGVVVGDPVIGNLTKVFPSARGYPVQYPASTVNTSVPTGANDVVERLKKQDKACPSQKFALIGYSQGAGVMHSAATKIPVDIQKKIVALVMFGDPLIKPTSTYGNGTFPPELQSKLLQNCAVGDMVCDKGSCFFHHLQYIRQPWVDKTVNYLVAAFKGTPMKAVTSGVGLNNDGK